jgi:hypothetical protein
VASFLVILVVASASMGGSPLPVIFGRGRGWAFSLISYLTTGNVDGEQGWTKGIGRVLEEGRLLAGRSGVAQRPSVRR